MALKRPSTVSISLPSSSNVLFTIWSLWSVELPSD